MRWGIGMASVALVVCAVLLTGCATNVPMGAAYTKLTLPVTATGVGSPDIEKIGTAECKSYCGMVALGNASIEAAMKNGRLTKVHHVDWDVISYAGIYAKYKVIVYGE